MGARKFWSMPKLFTLGRYFFATAIIASGILQLVSGSFVRLVPKLPTWIPWPSFWACTIGAVIIVAGGAIIAGYRTKWAATVIGALLLLTFLFQRVPEMVGNPFVGFIWTNPFKVLALLGGAITLRATRPLREVTEIRVIKTLPFPLAAWLLGAFLIICGIQHFVYADFVDGLVPAWIPPTRRFWTLFAGAGLLAGGLGVFFPKTRRQAATWSGVMIFLWVLLLHIPRVVTETDKAFEMGGVFEALAISGVAFLMAGELRGTEFSQASGEIPPSE
jgi:uncharacterized membrane protein